MKNNDLILKRFHPQTYYDGHPFVPYTLEEVKHRLRYCFEKSRYNYTTFSINFVIPTELFGKLYLTWSIPMYSSSKKFKENYNYIALMNVMMRYMNMEFSIDEMSPESFRANYDKELSHLRKNLYK